jgi:hypothetical protein
VTEHQRADERGWLCAPLSESHTTCNPRAKFRIATSVLLGVDLGLRGCIRSVTAARTWVTVDWDCGPQARSYGTRPHRAPRVPTMPNLSGSTILIVGETPDVSDLRTRMVESGATVHVVSVAGASLMVRQKQIDSAFIAANLDERTQELCAELDSLGIARVFLTPERTAPEPALVRGQFKSLRRKLRSAAIA